MHLELRPVVARPVGLARREPAQVNEHLQAGVEAVRELVGVAVTKSLMHVATAERVQLEPFRDLEHT